MGKGQAINKDGAKNWQQAQEWKTGAELFPEIAAIFRQEMEETRQQIETGETPTEEDRRTLALSALFFEELAQEFERLADLCEKIKEKTESKEQTTQQPENLSNKEEGGRFVECSKCAKFKQPKAWGFCEGCGAYLVSGKVWAITHGIPNKEEEAKEWQGARKLQTGADLLQKMAKIWKKEQKEGQTSAGSLIAEGVEKLEDLAEMCRKTQRAKESKADAMQKARHLSNKEKKQAEEFRQAQNLQNKKTKAKS